MGNCHNEERETKHLLATGKTVSWNVTAPKVNVETETEALAVKETGYYNMSNVVDLNEVTLLVMHHMQNSEFTNVGAGIGGGFENPKTPRSSK